MAGDLPPRQHLAVDLAEQIRMDRGGRELVTLYRGRNARAAFDAAEKNARLWTEASTFKFKYPTGRHSAVDSRASTTLIALLWYKFGERRA